MTEIYRAGRLRGDKTKYPDGIGCSIWYPLPGDEGAGICFDFPIDDIDNLIKLLETLKLADAEKYEREVE